MGFEQVLEQTYLNAGTGLRVNRATAADAVGPTAIFAITGGYVLLTGLMGVVTVLRAGALATTLFSHSTQGALCVAAPTVAAPVGSVVTITGDPADLCIYAAGTGVANTLAAVVQGGLKGSVLGGQQMFGIVLGVGNITTTIAVSTAGSTRYVATYIPLDDAAALNAA